MRDYQTKANEASAPDSIQPTKLGGGEVNSFLVELANAVISSGQTPAIADGTSEIFTQLGMTLAIYGAGGAAYHLDTGAVNVYVLNPVSPRKSPNVYFNGFTILFEPGTVNTGASTVNPASLGIKSIVDASGAALTGGELNGDCLIRFDSILDAFVIIYSTLGVAGALLGRDANGVLVPIGPGTAGQVALSQGPGLPFVMGNVASPVVQVVTVTDGEYATGATTTPNDDSIPQITEGNEFLSRTITPVSATNRLLILTGASWGVGGVGMGALAVHKAGVNDAVGFIYQYYPASDINNIVNSFFAVNISAAVTTELTFSLRIGISAGTALFNGISGRVGGGGLASGMTIIEYTP